MLLSKVRLNLIKTKSRRSPISPLILLETKDIEWTDNEDFFFCPQSVTNGEQMETFLVFESMNNPIVKTRFRRDLTISLYSDLKSRIKSHQSLPKSKIWAANYIFLSPSLFVPVLEILRETSRIKFILQCLICVYYFWRNISCKVDAETSNNLPEKQPNREQSNCAQRFTLGWV